MDIHPSTKVIKSIYDRQLVGKRGSAIKKNLVGYGKAATKVVEVDRRLSNVNREIQQARSLREPSWKYKSLTEKRTKLEQLKDKFAPFFSYV